MLLFKGRDTSIIEPSHALPGRAQPLPVAERHVVLHTPLRLDAEGVPPTVRPAVFGMGCFWGAERIFWEAPGVYTTAVGYAGGTTPNPTYEEVCSGRTGHSEVVLVGYDTAHTTFEEMLRLFWEGHDPTQGMRQGNDVGTQYRSLIACFDAEQQRSGGSLTRRVSAHAHRRRAWPHHHRNPAARPPATFLLRRGLPPAVLGEGAWRVLRAWRHWCGLSGGAHERLTAFNDATPPRRGRAHCIQDCVIYTALPAGSGAQPGAWGPPRVGTSEG